VNKGLFRCIDATNQVLADQGASFFVIFINLFNNLRDFSKAMLEYIPSPD